MDYSPETAQDLATRLTLVTFGAHASDLPATSVVPVLALPDWSRVDALIEHITNEK